MTKEKYLAKLRQQLLFRLSNSEIGFMFYWYYILATMDPTDNSSLAFLFLKTTSGKNYVIWGTVIAAAVLVLTIISKLAKRKKVG